MEEYVNFTKRTAFVQEYYPSEAEIRLYESVSNYLMREGTYGIPERQRPPLSLLVRKILIPLQKEVMELSREHDALRRQIRKEHNATIKLQLKKEEMQMSRNLNQKRLFDNYCCMIIKL